MSNKPLPANALAGKRIAISVSKSEDLARLGLLEMHFELALAEIARCILMLGGGLAYGGHLRPDGYTHFLMNELGKYANLNCTLDLCLRWHEHRSLSLTQLQDVENKLNVYGNVICLDIEGNEVSRALERGEAAEVPNPESERKALSAMRRFMTSHTDGRVLLGGKRRNFSGVIPGLAEEALGALQAQQPLYLAGGFGGMCLDIAQTIENIYSPTQTPLFPPYTDVAKVDPCCAEGIRLLQEKIGDQGWAALNNGLTREENVQLATTHRPREIAAWVSVGLARKFKFESRPS